MSADKALENGTFIDAANKYGSAFAETYITESAIDMERVEIVFDF
ncbi:MAG TPA: hypothetical protein VGA86_01710 [Desulfatiglandales bacterium]